MTTVWVNDKPYSHTALRQIQKANRTWDIFEGDKLLHNVIEPLPEVSSTLYVEADPVTKPPLPEFNKPWQPSLTAWATIGVTLRFVTPNLSSAVVSLRSESKSPPERQVDSVEFGMGLTLPSGSTAVAGSIFQRITLFHDVPPGHYCMLVPAISGPATVVVVDYKVALLPVK